MKSRGAVHERTVDDGGALEERVQAGNAFYLGSIERDLANGRLHFEIVGDPDKGEIVRTLTFIGVWDFNEEWFEEPDPLYIEQIIGLHRYQQERGSRYVIHMDQSEMIFFTEAEPIVAEAELPAL